MKKITSKFILKKSHLIDSIGFSGSKKSNIKVPIKEKKINVLGYNITDCEILEESERKYRLEFKIDADHLGNDEITGVLESLAKLISFHICKQDCNHHYGNYYIEFLLFETKIEKLGESKIVEEDNKVRVEICDHLNIQDAVSFTLCGEFRIDFKEISRLGNASILLDLFYDFQKSNLLKTKFFNLFHILEYLENSDLYERLYQDEKLFTEIEVDEISKLAEAIASSQASDSKPKEMGDRKKSILLELTSKTLKNRQEKLVELLREHMKIESYNAIGGPYEINKKTIKDILNARHKLFHRGKEFKKEILWCHLLPICMKIIEKITIENFSLD